MSQAGGKEANGPAPVGPPLCPWSGPRQDSCSSDAGAGRPRLRTPGSVCATPDSKGAPSLAALSLPTPGRSASDHGQPYRCEGAGVPWPMRTAPSGSSSMAMGCWPVVKSMMARRVMPSPTPRSTGVPASSGPRWARQRSMAANDSGAAVPTYPVMPHIRCEPVLCYGPVSHTHGGLV